MTELVEDQISEAQWVSHFLFYITNLAPKEQGVFKSAAMANDLVNWVGEQSWCHAEKHIKAGTDVLGGLARDHIIIIIVLT